MQTLPNTAISKAGDRQLSDTTIHRRQTRPVKVVTIGGGYPWWCNP